MLFEIVPVHTAPFADWTGFFFQLQIRDEVVPGADVWNVHKETLYLLSLQYLSTSQLAHMRDQSDRNIRKLRDNYTKKLQKQLYGHLFKKIQQGQSLTFREREFLGLYETALNNGDDTKVKVKQENKYPKRKKNTGTVNSTGTEVGVAV